MGNNMKRARINADYKSIFDQVAAQMAQQLVDANTFVVLLAGLPANAPQP
jgi:hypothetical protein